LIGNRIKNTTGDLARAFAMKVGATGQVVLSDINAAMLSEGRKNLINKGVSGVQFAQLSGEQTRQMRAHHSSNHIDWQQNQKHHAPCFVYLVWQPLARAFAMKVGATGQVVLSDINAAMLSEGRKNLINCAL
jgi:ubiquinone/menaquinone biosynthesis C-methylase UbiE